jgi:hypothetical protein
MYIPERSEASEVGGGSEDFTKMVIISQKQLLNFT